MFEERSKCNLKTHKTLNCLFTQLIRKFNFTSDFTERENKGCCVGGRSRNEAARVMELIFELENESRRESLQNLGSCWQICVRIVANVIVGTAGNSRRSNCKNSQYKNCWKHDMRRNWRNSRYNNSWKHDVTV